MSDRLAIAKALRHANPYTLQLAHWRATWLETARPHQIPPAGDWETWALVCGRGYGKTRVGAEATGYQAASQPHTRWAVVGPTQNDVRSVCFEGKSGLLKVIPPALVRGYNSSSLEVSLKNGSLIVGKSAEKPDRLRGPEFHGAWCDEIAAWGASAGKGKSAAASNRLQDTWDNLLLGLRLGVKPRKIITTTPRPLQFLRDLVKDPTTHLTQRSTFDNIDNLAPSALAAMKRIFDGTRRGQQELYAEILETNEGALWTPDMIEAHRVDEHPELVRIVVAIDPAVTSSENSDETGIIVVGLGDDGRIYVLEDISGKYKPRAWARLALRAYHRHKADCIVGETNQGGDLVETNLRAEADEFFKYKSIHAKRGKYLRAEPIAAYYEKGMVSHVGIMRQLEKQMLNFVGFTGENSPDRLDALVYGVGELMQGTIKHDFW